VKITPPGPQIDPALWRGLTQRRVSRRDLFKAAGVTAGTMGLSAVLSACGVAGSQANKSPSATGVGSQAWWDQQKKTTQLDFANWPLYIDPSILKTFTKQTGIDVTYRTVINDNDPFLAKIIPALQAGQGTGYDLCVNTNGGPMDRLIALGYVIPIDHRKIPNFFKYADPNVKGPTYDPTNKYTVTWQSGFTAIGYNSKYVKNPPRTFNDLLNSPYKNKVGMFGNNQDLPCPALVAAGFDVQTSTPDQWKKAAEPVMRARDNGTIRSFYDQGYIDALENGDTLVTQAWSGDIFIAAAPKSIGGDGYPEMRLNLPTEGSIYWHDNMWIPLHAQNPVSAMTMMNFVYDPPIAAKNADFIWYVCPVPSAKQIVLNDIKDPAVANSPLVFPTAADIAKTQGYRVWKDTAEEEEWNSIWEPVYSS
jgi:spermidine/putrescine transport system substrate-binding protein